MYLVVVAPTGFERCFKSPHCVIPLLCLEFGFPARNEAVQIAVVNLERLLAPLLPFRDLVAFYIRLTYSGVYPEPAGGSLSGGNRQGELQNRGGCCCIKLPVKFREKTLVILRSDDEADQTSPARRVL